MNSEEYNIKCSACNEYTNKIYDSIYGCNGLHVFCDHEGPSLYYITIHGFYFYIDYDLKKIFKEIEKDNGSSVYEEIEMCYDFENSIDVNLFRFTDIEKHIYENLMFL